MLKAAFILVYFFGLGIETLEAQYIIVKCKLYPPNNSSQNFALSKSVRNPTNGTFDKLISYYPINSDSYSAKLNVNESALYWISYGGMPKKIILMPNDSINIEYKKLEKPDTIFLSKTKWITKSVNEVIGGNNIEKFTFFDSLETKTGPFIHNNYKIDKEKNDWEYDYKALVTQTYKARMNYLSYFTNKYSLDKEFIILATIEIKSRYFNDLMSLIYQNNSITKSDTNYYAEVENELKNSRWTDYKKSNEYSSMVWMYLMHFLNREGLGTHTSEQSFSTSYRGIIEYIKDDSIRNYHLTNLMSTYLEKQPSNYDEYFQKYMQDCTNMTYRNEIAKLYLDYMAKYNNAKISNQLLNTTTFKSFSDKSILLKNILSSKKPILLDFWASWCGPCLMIMPNSKEFEDEYKNKIDFIYISIDEKENLWRKAITDNNLLGNHYLLKGERKSEFAKFLKLTAVPRYVLIKNGKIIIFKGSGPLANEAFKTMLDNSIKN